MTLRKWSYKKRVYEPYEIPDEWNVATYSDDMDKVVQCAQCGREVKFGDTYTSHEVHTKFGMGYAVCDRCYDEELYYKTHKRGNDK